MPSTGHAEAQPLRDRSPILRLLTGRGSVCNTRASWRRIVATSALPHDIQSLIGRVIRQARGWRSERCDTARELVAHFTDALAAGQPVAEAIAAFGNERDAARLLKRAIRRKRSIVWHGWWYASRTAMACMLVVLAAYGWLAARFYLVKPTIAVDYIAKLQGFTPPVPQDDCAWPLIRTAFIELKEVEADLDRAGRERWPAEDRSTILGDRDPASVRWAEAERALARGAASVARLRDATRRPTLGVRLNEFSSEDAVLYEQEIPSLASGEPAHGIRLPHLAYVQYAARWLGADARHAAARGDHDRAIENIDAILRLARQVRGAFVVEQLVARAIAALGFDAAAEISWQLAHRAPDRGAAGAESVTRLAQVIEDAALENFRISFDGETLMFDDMLQRCYSDDGQGDGHITHAAMTAYGLDAGRVDYVVAPAVSALIPSRAEMRRNHAAIVARASAALESKPWELARVLIPDDLDPSSENGLYAQLRNPTQLFGVASLPQLAVYAVSLRVWRDTARIATALARYRREHGSWPDRLEMLVPHYLADLPRDPLDGDPLRYAVRDDVPLVWSIGPDLTDDGLPAYPINPAAPDWSRAMRGGIRRTWSPTEPQSGPPADILLWPPESARLTPMTSGDDVAW
jgi:hypothetical protein